MNRALFRHFWLMAAIVTAGLTAVQAVRHQHAAEAGGRGFSEQVNLALRYTAHRLLIASGNRTGAIPPVEHPEDFVWLIRLEQNFEYDSVPPVLSDAFALHGIEGNYNVSVVECLTDNLMLGFTASTFRTSDEVPCGGRDQTAGCYNLRVSFPERNTAPDNAAASLPWLGALILLFLAFWLFARFRHSGRETPPAAYVPASDNGAGSLRFGRSAFDVQNQKITVNGTLKDLTYREAKLLRLFVEHANTLLERDRILRSVWEDEGIMVGRSVDVFVSRLRKLLKEDETVSISNVHGIGYRLEVSGTAPLSA